MTAENYNVAVKLSLVNHVSAGLLAMSGQFNALQRHANLFQSKLRSLKAQVAIGAGFIAGGTAIAAPIVYAATQAGKLQQQLKMVQIATHATTDEMEKFHQTVSSIALKSIFTNIDVATIAKTLSTAGNFTQAQVSQLLPSFVNFAQFQKLLKGTDYAKSVDQAIKLAEITGNFDPTSIQVSLNALSKLSLLMPGSVDKVLGAFKYMEGTMKNVMGLSDEQSLYLVAALQRMGIEGTRAGSQLLAFVTRTVPQVMWSGLLPGMSKINLQNMGLLDETGTPKIFTNGKLDPLKLFHGLADFVTREFKTLPEAQARATIDKMFAQTFGASGTRIAAQFLTPQAVKMFQEIEVAYNKHPNLDIITEDVNTLFAKQLPQTFSALKTVVTDLGYAILPDAITGLSWFNDKLEIFDKYVNTHSSTIQYIERAILAVAGLSIVGGVLIALRAGLAGLLIPFQMFTGAIGILELTMSPAIISIGGIVAALALFGYGAYKLYEILKTFNWNPVINGIKEAEKAIVSFFKNIWNVIKHPISSVENLFHSKPSKEIENRAKLLAKLEVNPATDFFHGIYKRYPERINPINKINPISKINPIQSKTKTQTIAQAIPSKQNAIPPIHLHATTHVMLDKNKVGTAVVNHIYDNAIKMPSSTSHFDSSISPLPSVINALGFVSG